MVIKQDGQYRVCGDYRRLNSLTVPDRYPVPFLTDFANMLQGRRVFSKLDLKEAFQQIPMETESIRKTAVATPFGLFEYKFMPYGLRNAAQTLQRYLDEIFRDMEFVFIYIDDFLVASRDEEEHAAHLRRILQRLSEHRLSLSMKKCLFAKESIDYLGHTIDSTGIRPTQDKISTIKKFPKPATKRDMKRFIGLANFYRRFLPGAAKYLSILDEAARTQKKNDLTPISWSSQLTEAFEEAKMAVANATLLAHPSNESNLVLHVDASDTCVGAALSQDTTEGLQPLGFYSHKLSQTKQRYSTYDRELEAIFRGVRHFKDQLEGRHVVIYTDHKPLTFAMNKLESTTNQRQARQLDLISQYTTDIRYVPGEENSAADALSRISSFAPRTISSSEIAAAQQQDPELQSIKEKPMTTGLQLKPITEDNGTTIWCDLSTGSTRPFIPVILRNPIIKQLHNLTHPGTKATARLVKQHYVWPGCDRDSHLFAKQCNTCQAAKKGLNTITPLMKPVPPNGRFKELNVDIIGPYPPSRGYRFALTIIDRFTRWPAAIPMEDATAKSVANAMLTGWVQSFGVPHRIITDRGSAFTSELYRELNMLMGTNHKCATAYHPQANGMIERWHRTLKNAIKCHTELDWAGALPMIILGLRCTFQEDLNATPAEMVFGQTLQLPGAYFEENEEKWSTSTEFVKELRRTLREIRTANTSHHRKGRVFIPKDLSTCSHVFLRRDATRRPFQRPYDGPFRVISRNDKTITIDQDGKQQTVSMDRTKPAYTFPSDQVDKPIEATSNRNPLHVVIRQPQPRRTTTARTSVSPPDAPTPSVTRPATVQQRPGTGAPPGATARTRNTTSATQPRTPAPRTTNRRGRPPLTNRQPPATTRQRTDQTTAQPSTTVQRGTTRSGRANRVTFAPATTTRSGRRVQPPPRFRE
jgi:cleavage and polyadenylation specificity factor subunit 1